MSEQTAGQGRDEPVETHPDVQVERSERLVEQDAPNKQHGDALRHGSGNRHGVHGANQKPNAGG